MHGFLPQPFPPLTRPAPLPWRHAMTAWVGAHILLSTMPFAAAQGSPPSSAVTSATFSEATHPLGQTLVVTAGVGLVQQQGQPAQAIRPGDVVSIPAQVRHWHGASPASGMTHVAVAEKANGVSVTWQEKVSDPDYAAAAASAGIASATPALASTGRAAQVAEPSHAMAHARLASTTLSAKQQAIVLMASFMATSDMPKLNAALNEGLDAGMSLAEAKEVLVQLYAYTGFPKSLNALGELLTAVEARKGRGIHDAPGREPSRTVATGHELVAAGKANQTEIAGGPVQGPVFDFAPVINQFLQTHLFGDIFERDNLDWQSRELATVGALSAMPGVEAQLRSHMRASLRVGVSTGQLRQLVHVLAERGHPDAAQRAHEALSQALAAAAAVTAVPKEPNK